MPTVPPSGTNMTGYGQSPLSSEKPSETDLLMAAADMHGMGRLTEPSRSMPQGPERPKLNPRAKRQGNRPLKVVK